MFCPLDKPENQELKDLNKREIFTLLPLTILVFVMGFFPRLFLDKMDASVNHFLNDYNRRYKIYAEQKKMDVKSGFASIVENNETFLISDIRDVSGGN